MTEPSSLPASPSGQRPSSPQGAIHTGHGTEVAEPAGASAAERWAWLLGFCLPLGGGTGLREFIPDLPGQVTPIRVVTIGALVWLAVSHVGRNMPVASRRLITGLAVATAYATLSLLWTPDKALGVGALLATLSALGTGVAVVFLVASDRQVLGGFARGLIVASIVQIAIALIEVSTAWHIDSGFNSRYEEQFGIAGREWQVGAVAWGTLSNPNNLGAFLLIAFTVFLSTRAYGVQWSRRRTRFGWSIVVVGGALALTSLSDARAVRLGLLAVVVMHLFDWVVSPRKGALRVSIAPILVCGALAFMVFAMGPILADISDQGGSDAFRLQLATEGARAVLGSAGFGLGIGSEGALIESGALSSNYHNILVQTAVEIGLIAALAIAAYLSLLILGWAFGTSPSTMGAGVSRARATAAVSLVVYGSVVSSVLQDPVFWTFLCVTVCLKSVAAKPEDLRTTI